MTDETEFDCGECGMRVVALMGDVYGQGLCAECIALPGWFNDPVLRKMLDPNNDAKPPVLPVDGQP